MLSQEDVERVSGDRLARLYRLIIYPGHHEYVTEAEYDAVQLPRPGGDLAPSPPTTSTGASTATAIASPA
jgi:hypothetical protein